MTDVLTTNYNNKTSLLDNFYAFAIGATYYQIQPKLMLIPMLMNLVNSTNDNIFYSMSAGFLSSPSINSVVVQNIAKPISLLINPDKDFYTISAGFLSSSNINSIITDTSLQLFSFVKNFAQEHPIIMASSMIIGSFALTEVTCKECKLPTSTTCKKNKIDPAIRNISDNQESEFKFFDYDLINNFLYGAMLRLTIAPPTFMTTSLLYYQTTTNYNVGVMTVGYSLGHLAPNLIQEAAKFIVSSSLSFIYHCPIISELTLLVLTSSIKIQSICESCSDSEFIAKCNSESKSSYSLFSDLTGETFVAEGLS